MFCAEAVSFLLGLIEPCRAAHASELQRNPPLCRGHMSLGAGREPIVWVVALLLRGV
jgi:hypothetical protein